MDDIVGMEIQYSCSNIQSLHNKIGCLGEFNMKANIKSHNQDPIREGVLFEIVVDVPIFHPGRNQTQPISKTIKPIKRKEIWM
jgi:hypothetical protein